MKSFLFIISTFLAFNSYSSESFYSLKARKITGEELNFEQFKGKTVLFVNIASRCGYTPQLQGLQELFEKFRNNSYFY